MAIDERGTRPCGQRLRSNGGSAWSLAVGREGLHGSRWWHGIARVERIRSGGSQLEEGTQSPGLEYFTYVHCMLLACMFVLFALEPHRHVPRWRRCSAGAQDGGRGLKTVATTGSAGAMGGSVRSAIRFTCNKAHGLIYIKYLELWASYRQQ